MTEPLKAGSNVTESSEKSDVSPIIGPKVELQLITTLTCNLKCTYCSLGDGDMLGSQGKVQYAIDNLDTFVQTHLQGKEIYVTFYGGEPSLNPGFIRDIIERFQHFRLQMQTNGTLLHKMDPALLSRLSNILVSIDGGKEITDGYRGKGIYDKVLKNIKKVRSHINGTIIARVTWGNPRTTFEELDELISGNHGIDYVYWQFATGDLYQGDSVALRKVQLRKLIERFFARTDSIYPFIPLMGITRNKLFPEKATEAFAGMAQCRVSTHLLNIMPDGKIFPCPDMMYDQEMQTGDIRDNWLRQSPLRVNEEMPCYSCDAYSWCRGNCTKDLYLAYVQKNKFTREKVVEPICDLLRFIGREIDRHSPQEWFNQLSLENQQKLAENEVYEYVEIMP